MGRASEGYFQRALRGAAIATLACLAALAFVGPTAAHAAGPSWQSGPIVESPDVQDFISGNLTPDVGTFLSYYADPANPPQVGQTYYVAIDLDPLADDAAGIYADVNLVMPPGTAPAVTAQTPVVCYLKFPGTTTYTRDAGSDCPQSLPQVRVGPSATLAYSLDPQNVNPPFWPLPWVFSKSPSDGDVEILVPVVSSQPLNGSQPLQGYVQIADGQDDPTLVPQLAVIVNPAGSQSSGTGGASQQLGVLYPSPSITSNTQPGGAGTGVIVGIKGFVQNNSVTGPSDNAIAQLGYADAQGDCSNPRFILPQGNSPTTFYSTSPALLQNPQTQITGSFTGLFPNVAYCWRIDATVTNGPQPGEIDGNWQYFVTTGTYFTVANDGEPGPATLATAPQCGAGTSGTGCVTSNCNSATSNCSTGASITSFSGGKTTLKTTPIPTPTPTPIPIVFKATLGVLHAAKATRSRAHILLDTGIGAGCPHGGSVCSLTLAVTYSQRVRKHKRVRTVTTVVGRLSETIAAGRSSELTLTLTSAGAKLLSRHKSLKLLVTAVAHDGSGPKVTLSRTITVHEPPLPHRKRR